MPEALNHSRPAATLPSPPSSAERTTPAIHTNEVYVVLTSAGDQAGILRIAGTLATALDVPLTVVYVRALAPHGPDRDAVPVHPGTDVMRCIGRAGVNARVRVFSCAHFGEAIPFAFRPHSLVVLGGRRSWWPTETERWRRALEAAGHFVVFVANTATEESSHA